MHKLNILLISALLIVSYPSHSLAGTNKNISSQLQVALDNYRMKMHIPGMAMSITSHNKNNPFHYILTSGTTTFHGSVPVKSTNLFQVGSITKSFTAALVLQIEANPNYKFNIDQPLGKWLPQYPQWKNITIRQLLNHTSGIYNYTETIMKNNKIVNPGKYWTAKDLVAIATKHPLYFQTGKGWHYSNTNYVLAGMVVEAVTGKNFTQEMQNLITKANLQNTYYIPETYPANLLPRMVHGYNANKQDITQHNLSWAAAAGAIVSNATDIDKWANELLIPNVILPKKQLLEMQTLVCQTKEPTNNCSSAGAKTTSLQAPTYGLGIAHYKNIWWHDGGMEGYTSTFMNEVSNHVTLCITANVTDKDLTNEFHPLTKKVAAILLNSSRALTVR